MDKITEAKTFLSEIGMPKNQQSEVCAYALLTLAHILPYDDWHSATNDWIRIHDILQFAEQYYNKSYAENTRETIRKNCMHQFRDAALIEDNGKATNSPNYRYRLTKEALILIKTFNSPHWPNAKSNWFSSHITLVEKYASKKRMEMMDVNINGQSLHFSPGKHNSLQKAIIEDFAPRFAPGCECLYVGDTIKKDLIKNVHALESLGFEITLHDKMPDVVLYRSDNDWLYFVEAVTSVGPMSPKRIIEINNMTRSVKSGKIYVTAFPDIPTYKRFAADIAWETEVWIADAPDHMIHLNGDRFMGPRIK